MPSISIVMPVYNEAAYIDAAIDSVLAQQYDGERELVVVLGPSTDGTTETVVARADADTRIKSSEGIHVIRMPEHYGVLSPILHVVPLQLLAYHTACARGTDVDKPRNLAKSVTVE